MSIIFDISSAEPLTGTDVLDLNGPGVSRTVQDGRVIITSAPSITWGRLDLAAMMGFPGRDVYVYQTNIANTAGSITGMVFLVGPEPPGSTARNQETLDALVTTPGILEVPRWIPALHLLGFSIGDEPVRLIIEVDQFQSGVLLNQWTRGQLTV